MAPRELIGSSRFPEFPTNRRKNHVSQAQIWASLSSWGAVKSQIPSRYLSFSRFPHRILVNPRSREYPSRPCKYSRGDVDGWSAILRNAKKRKARKLLFKVILSGTNLTTRMCVKYPKMLLTKCYQFDLKYI